MQRFHVDSVWFNYISNGIKIVEGRKGSLNKHKHLVGQKVVFYTEVQGIVNEIVIKVVAIHHYDNLYDYLLHEGLTNTLPGVLNLEDGIFEYHKYYSDADIKTSGGINALVLKI